MLQTQTQTPAPDWRSLMDPLQALRHEQARRVLQQRAEVDLRARAEAARRELSARLQGAAQ